MPQLIVPAIIAVGVGTATSLIVGKVSGTSSKQMKIAKEQIAGEEAIALQRLEAEKTAQAKAEEQSKTAFELSEKKLVLDSQRMQIDTLANIINTQKAINQSSVPQYFTTPRRQVGFLENINSRIHQFFNF